MRGGTAIIDNSLIQIDTDKWTDTRNAYTGSTWDDDAAVSYAAVVIGNNGKTGDKKYQYSTDITFRKDTIEVIGKYKDLKNVYSAYLYANQKKDLGITFRHDTITKFLPKKWEKGANFYITEEIIE